MEYVSYTHSNMEPIDGYVIIRQKNTEFRIDFIVSDVDSIVIKFDENLAKAIENIGKSSFIIKEDIEDIDEILYNIFQTILNLKSQKTFH